jgi:tripartite-type tricarboxylate transporter receptor subunit TctC
MTTACAGHAGWSTMRLPLIGLLAALVLAVPVCAQDFPSKPLKMVVPYPAGGGTDVVGRLVAQKLSERLGQPIIIENRSGASGRVGSDFVVKSAADGYTLLFNNETLAVAPSISKNLPYDATRDLTPIGMAASSIIVIGVHSSLPVKSLPELIALAKAEPSKLSYSTCGNGTIMHFAGEQLKLAAGISMTHVPYRGCAPAIQDAAAGQVPVFVNVLTNVINLEKAERVRVLAIGSRNRSNLAPDVPTVAEHGFPDFDVKSFQALYGPSGMPPNVVTKLAAELKEALVSSDLDQRLRALSFEPSPMSPEDLAQLLRSDIERWGRVAKAAHIEAE